MIVLLSGPLVGTQEFISSVILCCIYVAGLIEAGCFPTSRLGVGNVWPDLDLCMDYWLSAKSMLFCVCSRGGGGLSHVISVSSDDLLVWGHFA